MRTSAGQDWFFSSFMCPCVRVHMHGQAGLVSSQLFLTCFQITLCFYNTAVSERVHTPLSVS